MKKLLIFSILLFIASPLKGLFTDDPNVGDAAMLAKIAPHCGSGYRETICRPKGNPKEILYGCIPDWEMDCGSSLEANNFIPLTTAEDELLGVRPELAIVD